MSESTMSAAPTRAEIEQTVVAALARTLRINEGEIHPESNLENELGLDSLGMINVNIALEERFQIALPACEEGPAMAIKTVRDMTDFVAGMLERQEAATC